MTQIFFDIKKQLKNYSYFLLGYSGGLDSTLLLYYLKKMRDDQPNLEIRAMHVHHGLHADADAWIYHCQKQCNAWNISLIIKYVKIKNKKLGIEGSARLKRYNIFFKNLHSNEILLTGHHLDDQCETLLLALKRGSGPTGLSAMQKITKINQKVFFRPLLKYTRNELQLSAKKNHLSWIEDSSNQNLHYDRNFLRHKVLPVLKKRWPYFLHTTSRSAELCNQQQELLNEFISEYIAHIIQKDGSLLVKPLQSLSLIRNYAIIRYWIKMQGGLMPSQTLLKCIVREVIHSRVDACPRIKIGSFEIFRCRAHIYLIPYHRLISKDNKILLSLKSKIFIRKND